MEIQTARGVEGLGWGVGGTVEEEEWTVRGLQIFVAHSRNTCQWFDAGFSLCFFLSSSLYIQNLTFD